MIQEKIELLKEANIKMYLDDSTIRNIIFVYCPPKVGSTTLVSSIRLSATYKFKVLHIHDEDMLYVLTGVKGVTVCEIIKYNQSIGRNVYVIDVYRSPIERKMSEFFDKLTSFHFNNTMDNIAKYDIKRLFVRFNNIFMHIGNGDHYLDTFLDVPKKEIFDFSKEYLTEIVNGITYIKLRLQDSKQWGRILSQLLEAEITIINDYETEKKPIGFLYNRFKQAYKIPSNYLANLNTCPYLNFYFSPSEKNTYISEWSKKQTDSFTGYTKSEYEIYKNICLENKWYKDIQYDHYLDEGCKCMACGRKRRSIVVKARKGEMPSERLVHAIAVKEYKEYTSQMKNHLQAQAIAQSKRIRKKTVKPSLKNNLMENLYDPNKN